MEMRMSLDAVLTDLEEYLRFRKEEGMRGMVVSKENLEDLAQPPNAASPQGTASAASPQSSPQLTAISATIESCQKCILHETRTKVVPGQGSSSPDIMFIGEAPGADEDSAGLAFVGRAGKLLTKMIEAMGYTRDEVFIGNILKCRPPDNRKPAPEEMDVCMPYLKEQIAALKPKVIIAMGATAVHGLLDDNTPISKLRGKWLKFEGIDLMPTFHPAYLLRDGSKKHEVWEDLKSVLKHLGKEAPKQ
jgi:uracil-DNA glycosylase family 4